MVSFFPTFYQQETMCWGALFEPWTLRSQSDLNERRVEARRVQSYRCLLRARTHVCKQAEVPAGPSIQTPGLYQGGQSLYSERPHRTVQ